jgi:hypothetical protein
MGSMMQQNKNKKTAKEHTLVPLRLMAEVINQA